MTSKGVIMCLPIAFPLKALSLHDRIIATCLSCLGGSGDVDGATSEQDSTQAHRVPSMSITVFVSPASSTSIGTTPQVYTPWRTFSASPMLRRDNNRNSSCLYHRLCRHLFHPLCHRPYHHL